jgi:hypothetical protein
MMAGCGSRSLDVSDGVRSPLDEAGQGQDILKRERERVTE